ncbi:transporter substrate-binding domain-containing protein [Bdellovibrio sp. 22V]|uniref:substrate-binding periplasmic protein n=1 Tax=Bdellovibrio sp. 22V TaxID=3044166 RepID=UPI002543229E|nr:transporter substrate-binding domain-containing protein [Bdellovibrio sp. 22V]WII71238.1 transporter substrate-binding domain-containing protein [Bdellovibrio sp. 22V]
MSGIVVFLILFPFLAKAQTLQVGMSDVAPFAYEEQGQIKGIHYDLFSQLAKESGLHFEYTIYPHARMVNAMATSSPDLAIFFSVTCLKYKQHYEIQEKLYTSTPKIYLKDSVDIKKHNLRIGRLRGTCTDLISQYVKPEMLTEVTTMEQAIEMLKSNRLQGVCGLVSVIDFYKEKAQYSEKLVAYHSNNKPLEAVICRKKSLPEETKKKLEAAAKKLKKVHLAE